MGVSAHPPFNRVWLGNREIEERLMHKEAAVGKTWSLLYSGPLGGWSFEADCASLCVCVDALVPWLQFPIVSDAHRAPI